MAGNRIPRILGWTAVASLLTLALVAPAASAAPGGVSPRHVCDGYDYWFKLDQIDETALEEMVYEDGMSGVQTNWPGQEIEVSEIAEDGQSFDWESLAAVAKIVVKASNELHPSTAGLPATSGTVENPSEHQLGWVTFCGSAEVPTPSPSASAAALASPSPSATPTGSVAGATGTPTSTQPPTDTLPVQATVSSDGLRMTLVGLGLLLAMLLLATPSAVRRR